MLQVGASRIYKVPSAAAVAAQDNDIVEIDSGDYPGDVALWTANGLTIRAVADNARLDAAGRSCQGKAIWVVQGNGTSIEHVEFSGCRVPDHNGAGIRQEGRGLVLRFCRFHDNENGLLTAANEQSDVLIEHCEFDGNGAGDGQSHNLYVGRVRSMTMRFCSSHGARGGHLVKSRANTNLLLCNRLMDEHDGTSSYLVDLPDGGRSLLIGNVLQHGPMALNRVAVSYGEGSAANPAQELWAINNTYVNDRTAGSDFIRVGRSGTDVHVINNLVVRASHMLEGVEGQTSHNLLTDTPGFVDETHYDHHLRPTSPAVGAGTDPGKLGSFVLLPAFQYRDPRDKEVRAGGSRVDVGAYQAP